MKKFDRDRPTVHYRVRGHVGVVEHVLDSRRVDLDDKVPYSDKPELHRAERPVQAVEFELRLRVLSGVIPIW